MAKKKLTKKVVEDKFAEDTLEWGEPAEDEIEDIEEVEGTINVPEGLLSDSVFQAEDIPPTPAPPKPLWAPKTFFDFTYKCSHPENDGHCIECYNKARKG